MPMQESKNETPLNCELKSYSVVCLSAIVLDDRSASKDLEVDPNIRFKLGENEYDAFVHCTYVIGGFDFSCGVEGHFAYKEPITNENVVNAWYNACTMIYGILRGIFTTSIAQATHETKFLPAVMMIEEIKKKLNRMMIRGKQEAEEKQLEDDK